MSLNINNDYYRAILLEYQARNMCQYRTQISNLIRFLESWSQTSLRTYSKVFFSGSVTKNTAISLSSDLDLFISFYCHNESLSTIYSSLNLFLNYNTAREYYGVKYEFTKKQNVSIRLDLIVDDGKLKIDVTPGRQHLDPNFHSIYVSKSNTWKKTNIKQHINDVLGSGRTDEIKLLKIWRELNKLDFPSIYLEYLLIDNILKYMPKSPAVLANNFHHILTKLASDINNPLWARIIDPANSNNILSDTLNEKEKKQIIIAANKTIQSSSPPLGYTNGMLFSEAIASHLNND